MNELADVFAELDDPRSVNPDAIPWTISWPSPYAP